MDQEILEMYFDSRRKSGGEDLVAVAMGPGTDEAVITYSSAEGGLAKNMICIVAHWARF